MKTETLKFGDIARLRKDTINPKELEDIKYLGLEHINKESLSINSIGSSKGLDSNKFVFSSDDVLFGKLRPYFRKVFKPKFDGICSTDIWVVQPRDSNICKDFLFYLMADQKFVDFANQGATGTRMPRADWNHVVEYEVKKFTYEEQNQISKILRPLDNKIELNQKMNKTLEEIAKTLFKSWFIDFDPVRAKTEGRSTGLSKEISDLFPDSFEDSELGEMPRGWRIESLSKITSFKNGFAFKSKDWTESGKPVVKIGNVKPLILDIEGCSFISDDLKKYDEYLLSKGDILIGMTGYVGETCLVPKLKKMPYQNQRVGKLIPTKDFFKEFLFSFTRQSSFKRKVEEIAQGSAQQNVSGRDILELDFVFGNEEILKMFSDSTSDIFKKILSNFEENIILTELRDTLLPKLVSGDLKIPDAENLVKEAGI